MFTGFHECNLFLSRADSTETEISGKEWKLAEVTVPHCHRANLYQESAFESGIPRKAAASSSKLYRHLANSLAGRGKVTVAGSSKWRKIMPTGRLCLPVCQVGGHPWQTCFETELSAPIRIANSFKGKFATLPRLSGLRVVRPPTDLAKYGGVGKNFQILAETVELGLTVNNVYTSGLGSSWNVQPAPRRRDRPIAKN